MSLKKIALRFIPTLLAFPIGGEIVILTIGGVNTSFKALLGGAIAGFSVGLIQFFALRGFGITIHWIWSSALALSVSSFALAATLGFETSTSELAVKGLITGLFVGAAQALSQRTHLGGFILWGVATSLTWATAWVITSKVIVDADSQYAIFGSSGALVSTLIMTFLITKSFRIESK